MRLNRHFARGSVATVVLAFAAIVACSGGDRSSGVNGDGFKPPGAQAGPCTPGTVRDCGIELGRTGSLVDCLKGTQTCLDDKSWGTCLGGDTTFKAAAPPPAKGSPDPDLHSNAVGGTSTTCTDNPCNPYCKTFSDVPDTGISSDAVTVTTAGETVSLAKSNVPGGFQNKGTLDSQCVGSPTSQAYLEACQFDMRCGTKADGSSGCVVFPVGASDGCSAFPGGGIDITAPPVCVSSDASPYRNLTVCNRGSVDLTQDIQCMAFSGNSPHYPDANPGAGRIVLDTRTTADGVTGALKPINATTPLKAGECRTYRVPNSNFQSSGTESIICNPPSSGGALVTSTLDSTPGVATSTDWTNPNNARSNADSDASATVDRVRGELTGVYASAVSSADFAPTSSAQGASDGAFASATFPTTNTAATVPGANSSNTCSGGGCTPFAPVGALSLQAALAGNDVSTATAAVTKNRTPAVAVFATGLAGTVPAGCTIVSSTLTVVGSTSDTDTSGYVALKNGAAVINSVNLTSAGSPPASTVATTVLTPGGLGGLTLEISAQHNGNNGTGTVTINHITASLAYSCDSSVTMDASGFSSGFGSLPAGSTLDGFDVETKWRVGAASAAYLLIQPRLADGTVLSTYAAFEPFGYTAGTTITSTRTYISSSVTLAEMETMTIRLTGQQYGNTADMGVDSVRVTPRYRVGVAIPKVTLSNFGLSVPSGASNVKLTIYATGKTSGGTFEDALYFFSTAGHAAATWLTPSFATYQSGPLTLTDPTLASDSKLSVEVWGYKWYGSTSTISLESVMARLQYDSTVGANAPECNPHNNWTVNKANPGTICEPTTATTYPPWTVSRVFDGTCPVGSKPRWKYMGYTSSTPSGTKIEFRFRTSARDSTGACPTLPAAIVSPPAPLATAQLSPDTQVCSLTAAATATCPVNLTTGLGNTDSRKDCLQMDARGIPATTPPAAPTLTDWRVTYDCVPEE